MEGARLQLKLLDAARLALGSDTPMAEIHGVKEVWRAPAPRGAEVVAAWVERP